ncbi:DUF3299 domain-containing protein [Roseibium sp. SCPC15]|uniref:DUF3299 domain-containing protein n=1 Tax=Roseibium sp. SCP15 TaxID=3141376 RepID=UPI00333B8374
MLCQRARVCSIMRPVILLFACLIVSAPTMAGPRTVNWQDLVDPAGQSFEDPFRTLSRSTLGHLRSVVNSRDKLAEPNVSSEQRERLQSQLSDAMAALEAAEVDVEWLISQRWVVAGHRKRASRSGNAALHGQTIVLTGYAIPAPIGPGGDRTVYLVPRYGMCSHMPAPPANKMVRLLLPRGETTPGLYEKIRVSGKIQIEPNSRKMFLVDGLKVMDATWSLTIEEMKRMPEQSLFASHSLMVLHQRARGFRTESKP